MHGTAHSTATARSTCVCMCAAHTQTVVVWPRHLVWPGQLINVTVCDCVHRALPGRLLRHKREDRQKLAAHSHQIGQPLRPSGAQLHRQARSTSLPIVYPLFDPIRRAEPSLASRWPSRLAAPAWSVVSPGRPAVPPPRTPAVLPSAPAPRCVTGLRRACPIGKSLAQQPANPSRRAKCKCKWELICLGVLWPRFLLLFAAMPSQASRSALIVRAAAAPVKEEWNLSIHGPSA